METIHFALSLKTLTDRLTIVFKAYQLFQSFLFFVLFFKQIGNILRPSIKGTREKKKTFADYCFINRNLIKTTCYQKAMLLFLETIFVLL